MELKEELESLLKECLADRRKAKALILKNPKLKAKLREHLCDDPLADWSKEISDELINDLDFLIALDVDLNAGYFKPIEYAIHKRSIKLVNFLVKNQLHNPYNENTDQRELDNAIKNQRLPLQIAINEFKNSYLARTDKALTKIISILYQYTYCPFDLEKFKKKMISEIYLKITGIIEDAENTASKMGKKLIIMTGEDHMFSDSLLLITMVVLAANQIGINVVYSESDKVINNYVKENMGTVPCRSGKWCVGESLYQLSELINITTIPVDLDHETRDLNFRNERMFKEVSQHNTPGILTLGATHLKGMHEDYPLGDDFHVLMLNTCRETADEDLPDNVINLYDLVDVDMTFIAPDYAVEIAVAAYRATNFESTITQSLKCLKLFEHYPTMTKVRKHLNEEYQCKIKTEKLEKIVKVRDYLEKIFDDKVFETENMLIKSEVIECQGGELNVPTLLGNLYRLTDVGSEDALDKISGSLDDINSSVNQQSSYFKGLLIGLNALGNTDALGYIEELQDIFTELKDMMIENKEQSNKPVYL